MAGVAVGLDLAANPANASALAVLDGRAFVALGEAAADDALVAAVQEHRADVVAVDAPLTPPDGRSGTYANRAAERALRAAGYPALPPSRLGSLTFRGIALARRLRAAGLDVVEVFPRATLMRLGHRYGGAKQDAREVAAARDFLARHVAGLPPLASDHAVDAVAAALTGALHLAGETEALGDQAEGVVVVPRRVA